MKYTKKPSMSTNPIISPTLLPILFTLLLPLPPLPPLASQNLDQHYPLDQYPLMQQGGDSYQALFSLEPPRLRAPIALLIELETGTILYRKNETRHHPPASLVKIMTLYTALDLYEQQDISIDDPAEFSPAAWAENAPPGSSLMFLAAHQELSVAELMLGLLVSSGNDAAVALAEGSAGSPATFVAAMNHNASALGLGSSTFSEPSGYDHQNISNALDLARLSQLYINRWPWVLERFHQVREFSYPRAEHLRAGADRRFLNTTQYNRNGLIGSYAGASGLKTGYIDEAGYNIIASARRQGMHLLAVVMGIGAAGSSEGSRLREADARELLDFGFDHFILIDVMAAEVSISLRRAAEREFHLPARALPLVVSRLHGDVDVYRSTRTELVAPFEADEPLACQRWSQDGRVLGIHARSAGRAVQRGRNLPAVFDSLAIALRNLFSPDRPPDPAAGRAGNISADFPGCTL